MIEVANLSRKFGDFAAVDNISFSIKKEQGITALLGPNGAGKTTTMRMLTGFLKASDGSIAIDGLSLQDEKNLVRVKERIGYLPETTPLYNEMLVSEYLAFMGRIRGLTEEETEKSAQSLILELELKSHLYTPIGLLSKGFRQRVALAATLIHDPDIIILDEPTSGLDPNQITQIRRLIKSLGERKTLILSTHILQEVEDVCDRVIIINKGRIVADQPRSELMQASNSYLVVSGSPGAREKIMQLPEVGAITQPGVQPDHLHCELKSGTASSFFKGLAGLAIDVTEFRPASRSLADVFEELTRA